MPLQRAYIEASEAHLNRASSWLEAFAAAGPRPAPRNTDAWHIVEIVTNSFVPIAHRRTFEGAVEQIAERIRHGDYVTGDRLPSERELAATLRISRPTLRAAIHVLVDVGVLAVQSGSNGGIYIVSDYVPIDLLRLKSDLRMSEVPGVLEARRMIEPRVAQLAALHATDADFAHMQRTIDQQRALVAQGDILPNVDRFLQLDTQFHLTMARATGNTTVTSLVRTLFRRLEIVRDVALHEPPVAPRAIKSHERTLAAIQSADHDRIERVMDDHLSTMERAWERAADRVLIREVPDFLRPLAERGSSSGRRA